MYVSVKRKKSNASFRRVKEEDIAIKKKELADNAFEAKGVSSAQISDISHALELFSSGLLLYPVDSISIFILSHRQLWRPCPCIIVLRQNELKVFGNTA